MNKRKTAVFTNKAAAVPNFKSLSAINCDALYI